MPILRKSFSLDLPLSLDQPSRVPIFWHSGFGWVCEYWKLWKLTVAMTFHGVFPDTCPSMEGMSLLKTWSNWVSIIFVLMLYDSSFLCLEIEECWKRALAMSRADFHDYHHRLLYTKSGNYSSTFTYMDWWVFQCYFVSGDVKWMQFKYEKSIYKSFLVPGYIKVLPWCNIWPLYLPCNEQRELTASYWGTGWVWGITSSYSRLQEFFWSF